MVKCVCGHATDRAFGCSQGNRTRAIAVRVGLCTFAPVTSRFDPAPFSYWREVSPPPPGRGFRSGDLVADVVVVGLGAPGLLACGLLAEAGVKVVGIDAGRVGRGAAGANGGFLLAGGARFFHDAVDTWGRARASALWKASVDEIDAESREFDPSDLRLRRGGSLRLAGHPVGAPDQSEVDDVKAHAAALHQVGVDVRLREVGSTVGLFVPCDGWVDPARRVNAFARRAATAGALLLEGERVLGVESGSVQTTVRHLYCQYVLVTVDGHLEDVLPGLPVTSCRLEMARYKEPSAATFPIPTYMRWGFDYGFDLDGVDTDSGGLGTGFVLGGFRDRFLAESSAFVGPAIPSAQVQSELDLLASMVVGRQVSAEKRWAAAVAYTDDLWPFVAETMPGVWVVGGLSGHGNLIGPLAARAVAARFLGESESVLDWLAS